MKNRLYGMVAAMSVMILASGCSSSHVSKNVTADSIISSVKENTSDVTSLEMNCSTSVCMAYELAQLLESEEAETLDESDSSYEMNVSMDMEMKIAADPMSMFMDCVMTTSYGDESQSYAYQTYGVTSEDGSQMNIYTGSDDEWYTEQVDLSDYASMEDDLQMASNLIGTADASYELQSDTQELDGREVYVLKGTLKGETLQGVADAAGTIAQMLGSDIDLSDTEAPICYKVFADDLMPASVEIDMTDVMSQVMADAGVTISDTTVCYTFRSFNSTQEITVPDEVIDAAQTSTEVTDDKTE